MLAVRWAIWRESAPRTERERAKACRKVETKVLGKDGSPKDFRKGEKKVDTKVARKRASAKEVRKEMGGTTSLRGKGIKVFAGDATELGTKRTNARLA